jgi:putative transposase
MDQDTLRFLLREAVRETVTEVLQTVLELDRTAFLQAHGGRRNGYYPRRLETTFGQVDLKVPRDREGQYYPAFLKPYARRLVDVGEVAVALYAAGVSQRKAAEVMSFLLGHRYSHETISAMTEEVLQAVEAFRRRPLPEEMAFVYLDGLYLKLLREGEGVVREVVYVALGVTPSGERQVLGYWLLPAESALGWEGVLGELWQRGLRRVLLFITDGLPGLPEAIRRVYPQAEWQRCVVHGVRWSLGQVRARDRTLLAEDLRRVYGAESRGEALEALEALREAWGSRYPGVVALWAGDSGAFLRFYGYPKVLWPYLRSTNLMERFIREIRRGTKVRDHKFPGEEAVYKLLYLESERQEGRWAERRLKGFSEARETLEKMVSEGCRALLGLAVTGLSLLGSLQVWHLYLAVVAHAVTASFLTVAAGAAIPALVDQVDLTRANALIRLSRNLCDILGKVMAGLLLAWLGPAYTFLANAALTFASAALLLPLRGIDGGSPVVRGWRPRVLQDFVSGVGILRRHSAAVLAMADLVVINVGIPVLAIALPVISEEVLRQGAAGYGLLTGAMALGAIVATLIAALLVGRMDEGRLSGLATVLFGLLVVSLGFVRARTVKQLPVLRLPRRHGSTRQS